MVADLFQMDGTETFFFSDHDPEIFGWILRYVRLVQQVFGEFLKYDGVPLHSLASLHKDVDYFGLVGLVKCIYEHDKDPLKPARLVDWEE